MAILRCKVAGVALCVALMLVQALRCAEGAFAPPKDWKYKTSKTVVTGKINVHVTGHTHDDTG